MDTQKEVVLARWLQVNPSDDSSCAGRKENLRLFDLMETGGGQHAAEKMLARIRRIYWWPTLRTDIERKVQWCLSRAVNSGSGSL